MKDRKLYKAVILFMNLLIGLNISAQRRENAIKIGLIEPFLLTMGVSYERFFPDAEFSLQLNGSITKQKTTIWETLSADLFGYSAEIQGRYYFALLKNQSIPAGIYAGVYADYSQYQISINIPEGKVNLLDGNSKVLGFLFGYQRRFLSNFLLDGTIGGGYHLADYSGRFSEKGRIIPSIVSNGFLPKIDLKLGFAF